jgi:HK97 family phage prohead protease
MTNFTETFTETQYKSIPGLISTNEALGIVECFTAAIGNKDSVGDICLPGCFDASLRRRKPRVVWGHNWNEPIGKVLDIYEVGPQDPRLPAKMRANGVGGLYTRVQFNLKSERGKEAFSNIQFFGEEQEWSIGYKTLDATYDNQKKANLLKEVELYEVSPVLHGANQLTGTISIKADEQELESKGSDGPCWPGYKQVGMKAGKNGEMVPNCVPIEEKGAPLKDPKGGLTAAGRAHFRRTEGANLKPGVKGPADTPQKMRRKGSFLTRFFTNPSGPMKDEKGRPTRLALSAAAWGEPVPQDASDAAKLAAKGRRLLDRYENTKKKSDEQSEVKYMPIYSGRGNAINPINGRMGGLARHLGMHFGGPVTVREADENMVIFDLEKDGDKQTIRAAWHTPDGENFMFGPPNRVRVETVYLPIDGGPSVAIQGEPKRFVGREDFYGAMMRRDAEKHGDDDGDCGCGCGGAKTCEIGQSNMKSWKVFKDETPGLHLFVKTQNMEMYEAANEIGGSHGFDVELLADGFAVPNMDWYGPEAQNALMTALEGINEKALGSAIGGAKRRASSMRKPSRDGDSDGNVTNPATGEDDMPYVAPRMPAKPEEIPHEVPEKEPRPYRVPSPAPAPSRPAPSPSTPKPAPREVPARGVTGAMGLRNPGENLLSQLREFENDASNPSGSPKRAMDAAIRHLAKRNNISEEKVRKRLRQAVLRARRNAVLERAGRARGKSDMSVYVSISEHHDLEIKSGLQIESTEIDSFQIDIRPEFIFDVKSAIDAVAEYHGFSAIANDEGVKISGIASVTVDGVNALVNAISQIEGQQPLEVYELAKFGG